MLKKKFFEVIIGRKTMLNECPRKKKKKEKKEKESHLLLETWGKRST